jgi:hypothetical protein
MAIKKNDPYQSNLSDDEILRRRALQYDNELQPDPELGAGPAGGGRTALFAIAFIAILGVVFYGLNHSSTTTTSTPTAQISPVVPAPGLNAAATRPPAGTTTGSAMTPSPAQPAPSATPDPTVTPAAPAPSGATPTSPSSN